MPSYIHPEWFSATHLQDCQPAGRRAVRLTTDQCAVPEKRCTAEPLAEEGTRRFPFLISWAYIVQVGEQVLTAGSPVGFCGPLRQIR